MNIPVEPDDEYFLVQVLRMRYDVELIPGIDDFLDRFEAYATLQLEDCVFILAPAYVHR